METRFTQDHDEHHELRRKNSDHEDEDEEEYAKPELHSEEEEEGEDEVMELAALPAKQVEFTLWRSNMSSKLTANPAQVIMSSSRVMMGSNYTL